MKGRIDKNSLFYIERKDKEYLQHCVSESLHGATKLCAPMNCPAFREPKPDRLMIKGNNRGEVKLTYSEGIKIKLCREVGTLVFDELVDERRDVKQDQKKKE